MLNIFKKKLVILAAITLFTLSVPAIILADTSPHFLSGDIMTAFNNTQGGSGWTDTVSANPGEVIEFRVVAQNQGDQTLNDAAMTAVLPTTRAMSIQASSTVSSSNASSVSDTATVNVSGSVPQGFSGVIAGHTRIFGVTNLWNCASGCDISNDPTAGIQIGNLGAGESVQIAYKAYVTNYEPTPTPTATATASPTATPTATPTASPTATPVPTATATPGPTQTQTQTQSQSQSVTVNVPQVLGTTTVQGVTELPKTGLPLAGLALGSLLPAGLRLKKLLGSKGEDNDQTSANSIWEERQFKS